MKKKQVLMTAALAGIVSMAPNISEAGKAGHEKCKGVAPKGANSCGAKGHQCGGYAKNDYKDGEWIYVKEGKCAKIKKLMEDQDLKDFLKTATENSRKYKDNFPG